MNLDRSPKAMFGGLLWGDSLVRFIFMDEAGTSVEEPVTIVVGLIVNADAQLMLAEAAIREVLGAVPEPFRENFIFHATDIWNNRAYREKWSMADRLALLHSMMRLPGRLGIAISMGMARREIGLEEPWGEWGMTAEQSHHFLAFQGCVSRADKWIRENAGPTEVASIVAEDDPEMRKYLREIPRVLRKISITLPPGTLIPTAQERRQGFMTQQSEMRVTRTRSNILFVDKKEDPLVWLADACAFGLRRYFSGQQHGDSFVRAILGHQPVLEDWLGGTSATTWSPSTPVR